MKDVLRRYALLQAAATIYGGHYQPCAPDDPDSNPALDGWCVTAAESLLAEIERRDNARREDDSSVRENVTPVGGKTK